MVSTLAKARILSYEQVEPSITKGSVGEVKLNWFCDQCHILNVMLQQFEHVM